MTNFGKWSRIFFVRLLTNNISYFRWSRENYLTDRITQKLRLTGGWPGWNHPGRQPHYPYQISAVWRFQRRHQGLNRFLRQEDFQEEYQEAGKTGRPHRRVNYIGPSQIAVALFLLCLTDDKRCGCLPEFTFATRNAPVGTSLAFLPWNFIKTLFSW